MGKTLGLDLGTNSIGWALVDDDKENNLIEDKGVIIFSEGVKNEKGTEKSRAAERTEYRSARRLKFRRKIRKYQTLLVLSKNGMCPLSEKEVDDWRKSGFKEYPINEEFLKWLRTDEERNINPYYFRDKASRKEVEKLELGRAFYHMAQRRGFLSNRLDQSDKGVIEKLQPDLEGIINEADSLAELAVQLEENLAALDIDKPAKDLNEGDKKVKILFNSFKKIMKGQPDSETVKIELLQRLNRKENLGAVKQGISDLDEKIKNAKCQTLGQYFWKIYQQKRGIKENKIRSNYTAREDHYLKEFEIICKAQGLNGIDENKKDPSLRYSGIVKDLYKAIFYQRPLKSQKGLVGKCSLEPTKARCPASRPEYEEYRMYQFINNIKIETIKDENMRPLTEEERTKIIPKFQLKSKPTFTFDELAKVLGKENKYNFKLNATVSGCPTIAAMKTILGKDWKEKVYSYQATNAKGITLQRTADYTDIWHVLQTYTSPDKLENFAIEKLRMEKADAEKFSKINLKQDYASLSLNAINKILPYLKGGLIYSHSVFMANMANVVKAERWKNEPDRKIIQSEIKNIIDNHREKNKILFIVNSLLKNCKDSGFYYSNEAKDEYRKDLRKAFESEYGKKTWAEKGNKEQLLSEAVEEFKKHLKASTFLSIKRIDEKVIEFLDDHDLLQNPNKLYHPSDIEVFVPEKTKDKNGNEVLVLGSPVTGSIKNPMAMRTLHQLRKLVNTLLKDGVIDERTKINIELARELNDANKRKAIEKWQNKRQELHEAYEKKIKELYKEETGDDIEPTDVDIEKFGLVLEQRKDKIIINKDDILKYQLWNEQKHVCLYTGKVIGLTDFLSKNPNYDIEHTIPRSTSLDNSQMNKTLCENKFNREVKRDYLPSELNNHAEVLTRIEHWKERYEELDKEIERLVRATRGGYMEKEQKDRIIQKRHYLKMEYNYWKGKHDRFVMEEVKTGFKNSQFIDTGIITKYATAYMKSLFNKVYSVKGEMVDQYRKAWGLHEKELDKNGKPIEDVRGNSVYKKKDRSNHIHHCIDAVTIACMDKFKYDKLAHAWGLEDKGNYRKAKEELELMKPWKTFTQDVKSLKDEVLIVHHSKDVLPKQTKKKLRKRGKIQYRVAYKKDESENYLRDKNGKCIVESFFYLKDIDGKKIPVLGKVDKNNPDFILVKFRNSNSSDVQYKVLEPKNSINNSKTTISIKYCKYVRDEKTGKVIYQKQPIFQQGDTVRGSLHLETFYGAIKPDGQEKIQYVVRKPLKNLSDADLEKIVDKRVKKVVIDGRKKEKKLKKNIEDLKRQQKRVNEKEEIELKDKVKVIQDIIEHKLYVIPPRNGKTIFTPIRKVRVKAKLTKPLSDFKKHRDKSKHYYKQLYNVKNDENYCMAIYEGVDKRGKLKKDYISINNLEAGEYYRLANRDQKKDYELVPNPHDKTGRPLKYLLTKGKMVLFYHNKPEEVWELDKKHRVKRLYRLAKFDAQGRLTFRPHNEARAASDLKEEYSFDYDNLKEQVRLTVNNFNALVEGYDFKITLTGKIVKIDIAKKNIHLF